MNRFCFFTENHFRGGVDTFLIQLIENWPSKEADFLLVCNANHPSVDTFRAIKAKNFRLYTFDFFLSSDWIAERTKSILTSSTIGRITFRIFRKCFYFVSLPYYTWKIFSLLKSLHYDHLMVVNGGYPGSLVCQLASLVETFFFKRASIHNFHSHVSNRRSLMDIFLDRLLNNSLLSFVSVSLSCVSSLTKRVSFSSLKKYYVIPNGISDFKLDPKKERNARTKTGDYILMLATYHKYKGHEFLLEAFQIFHFKNPSTRLIICGDGTEEDKTRILRKINSLGLSSSVDLRGFVADKNKLISESLMVVLPSIAQESFGYVLIEAMALGVPFIATNLGGIPEVFESGQEGYLCEVGDFNSFAEAMHRLKNDNKLNQKMGKAGRRLYLKKYRAADMAKKYCELISNL